MRTLAAALFVVSLPACSTTLSTVTPARVLPPGDVHVGLGMNVNIPVSRIDDFISVSGEVTRAAADPNRELTDEQERELHNSALGLAMSAPGPTNDLVLRYGLAKGLEVGVRYTGITIGGDAKYQLLATGRWQAALGLGISKHQFNGGIFHLLEKVEIDDFSRYDVHVPLYAGRDWSAAPISGHLWFGAKYIYGSLHLDAKIQQRDDEVHSVDTSIHYYGGFLGGSVGYRKIFAYAELTAAQLQATPTVVGEQTDMGGLVVMPAFGMFARF